MGTNRNNSENLSKLNSNYIININSGEVREEKMKVYRYCWQCGKELPEGSTEPFCNDYDNYCRSVYYQELRKESEICYREWLGRD